MNEGVSPQTHRERELSEPHSAAAGARLDWLRAAVLGANDGIVSIGALVVGVAGANSSANIILTAGIAGVIAGALSMAAGEYVSVSSQRDTEKVLIEKERGELAARPRKELGELTALYEAKGLSHATAITVAQELTTHGAFPAHLEAELHIDPNKLANPWNAVFASAASFFSGALLPMIAIALPPPTWRIPVTFAAVVIALAITGTLSAEVGGANKYKAAFRVVVGGLLAMTITFVIGKFFNVAGI